MSAFEFFFSFYGLLLGLSVAVLATGAARAFKHRRTVRIGWLTPVLATFVALDIVTFWDAAWNNFRHLPYSYGLLIAGMVVATIYFVAASLIFPDETDQVTSLDDHFWSHRRAVLVLLILANMLSMLLVIWANALRVGGLGFSAYYAGPIALYLILVGTAAVTRHRWLILTALGLHIAVYLVLAVLSSLSLVSSVDVEAAPPSATPAPAAPEPPSPSV